MIVVIIFLDYYTMYSRFDNNQKKLTVLLKKSAWSSIFLSIIFWEFFVIDLFTGFFWIPGIAFLIAGIILFRLKVNYQYELDSAIRDFE